LFELTEELAAKELDINPKAHIIRESMSRKPSEMMEGCQLQFDNELVLPEETKIDSDPEYGLFFDAVERLHRNSYQPNPSSRTSSMHEAITYGLDEYGEPLERVELPWLKDPSTKISLWAIIKDCIGKDLSKVSVPVYINDPSSTL